MRTVSEALAYVRAGYEVTLTGPVTAVVVAVLSRRTFQVERDIHAGALTNAGEPIPHRPVRGYVFRRRG